MTDAIDRLGDAFLEQEGIEQEPEVTAEPDKEVEPEQPNDQPAEPEANPEPEAKEEVEKPQHTVPYGELKTERQKRQALEQQLEAIRQQQQAQPAQIPDAYEDPNGFNAYIQAEAAKIQWNANAEISKFKAETKYGEDKVKEAIAWAQEQAALDPTLDQRIGNSTSPVEYVVQQYQQSRTLEQLAGQSFEDAARTYAEKQGWIVSEPGQAPNPKPVPSPPRSLAKVPGAGASPKTDGADWDIFSSRGMGLKGR